MKLSEIILIGIVFFFVFGLALGTCLAGGPPPKVLIEVDLELQKAIEEEAPVLPDDFAKNDPPRLSAQWMEFIPPEVVKDDVSKKGGRAVATLFTSDGTWKCSACDLQMRDISAAKPNIAFEKIPVPAQGQSPSGLVPYWVAPDGTGFEGFMPSAKLEKWIAEHTPKEGAEVSKDAGEEVNEEIKGFQIVKVDGSSSSAVIAAMLENVARTELMKAGKLSPSGAVASSWLPEIDVDLDDPLLKVLDGLLSKDGMTLGGGKISWPAGKRVVSFDPPIDVSYRKILEVSATVKAIEVNGREVVVRMGGRLIPDLKVILK